jgi:hypothetical protein
LSLPIEQKPKNKPVEVHSHPTLTPEKDIRSMIEKTRSFTQHEFHQKESLRREENNSCAYVPPSSMIRRAEQLAYLLVSLGGQVF